MTTHMRYIGMSHVRILSAADVESITGIAAEGITADKRINDGVVEVDAKVAEKIVEASPEEWALATQTEAESAEEESSETTDTEVKAKPTRRR